MESTRRQPTKSVVISHLPLIFSRGCPSSVDKLDGDALVDFVRFLLRCALGVDEAGLKSIKRPLWWPRTVPYFNFNARKEVKKGHARRLRELVERCYRTNQFGYLLDLATRLSELFDQGRLHLVAGYDGTTALCESDSSRLVVSCRNENVNYDKTGAGMASPRRLLPVQSAKSRSGAGGGGGACHAGSMVQPPLCDIYLCDNCTAEFATIAEVRTHELTCGVAAPAEYAQQEPDAGHTDETPASLGFSATDQDTFLGCLGLVSASKSTVTGIPPVGMVQHSGSQPVQSYRGACGGGGGGVVRRALRARVPLFVAMCRIDVSSPLGRRLMRRDGQRARLLTADQMAAAIRGYEQHCRSKATHVYGPQRYPSSWKAPRCRRRGPEPPIWHHTICFNWRQRRDRLATIRTGLSRRSRALLARTRPCRVLATRLCPASSSTTLPALCHKAAKPLLIGGALLATTTAAPAPPPAAAAPAVAVAAAAAQLHPAAAEAARLGPDNSSVPSLSATNCQRPPEVRPGSSPKSQSAPLAPAGATVSCGGGGDGRASGGGRAQHGSSDVGAQCASGVVSADGGNGEVRVASGGGGAMEQLTSLLLRLPRPIGRMVQTVTGAVVDLCSSDSDSGDNCDNSDIVTRADKSVSRCATSTALPKRRSHGADGVLSVSTAKSPLSQTTALPPLPLPPPLLPLSLDTATNNNSTCRRPDRHQYHTTHSQYVPSLTGTAAAPPPLLPLGVLSRRSMTTAAPPPAALHSRRSVSSTVRGAGTAPLPVLQPRGSVSSRGKGAGAASPVLQPSGSVSSRGHAAARDTLCERVTRSPRTVRPPHSTSRRNSTLPAHSKNGISHWPELDKNLANGCSQLQFLSTERRALACVVVGSVSAAMPRAVL